MTKYYFVGTLLPSLSLDHPPEISFAELDRLLQDNLTSKDYEKTLAIRRYFDILNMRAFWLDEELDPRGELTSVELEEAWGSGVGLPDYIYDFLDQYEKKEERLHHFPWLLVKFFQSSAQINDPFLRFYLRFEREIRLVLTAFRAKKWGRDLSVELQYENPEEDLIAQLLAQQDAKVYEPPEKYQDLKVLFEKWGDQPLALQKALDEYRLNAIAQIVNQDDPFSLERLLAYLLQFIIIEKWFKLDPVKGIQIVDTLVKESYHGTNG